MSRSGLFAQGCVLWERALVASLGIGTRPRTSYLNDGSPADSGPVPGFVTGVSSLRSSPLPSTPRRLFSSSRFWRQLQNLSQHSAVRNADVASLPSVTSSVTGGAWLPFTVRLLQPHPTIPLPQLSRSMTTSPQSHNLPGPCGKRLAPGLDMPSGFAAHLFQPPRTPATLSYSSGAHRHGVRESETPSSSRKRLRADPPSNGDIYNTPYSAPMETPSIMRSDAGSPGPFVNTRYTCAGGLDTPGLAVAATYDNDINHRNDPHMNFRRRWSIASGDQEDTTVAAMGAAGNKRKKPASPNRGGGGWSDCLFTFVADTAGKVWEYARSSRLMGFYAGGGKGYTLQTSNDDNATSPTFRGHVRSSSSFDLSRTPVPGQYPLDEDDYAVRPSKRQHGESSSDSWIMVPRMSEDLRAPSPGLSKRRPPKVNIPRSTAARRPLIPVARRTSSVSSIGSPGLRPDSAASNRSRPHSRHTSGSTLSCPSPNKPHSPIPPEIQMLAAQRRKEDRKSAASMRKINDRLKDMIREGREALGTRIEVEDAMDEDMEDEGFAEGFFDVKEKW